MLVLIGVARAHFPTIDEASGGPVFHSLASAASVSDVTRSQAASRVSVCEFPYFWFKFNRPKGFNQMMVGGTVPVIKRFMDIRVAAALIGPGLPTSGPNSSSSLPDDITVQMPTGYGAIAVPAVPDQSSCWYFEDTLSLRVRGSLYKVSTGGADIEFASFHEWREPRCFFHEEFGGSDMWIVLDKVLQFPEWTTAGPYYVVFWAPHDQLLGPPATTAKFGAVFGDVGQSEDFAGKGNLAGDCSLPSQDFYENDCHGYHRPWFQPLFFECKKSTAVPVPNFYTCPNVSEGPTCNNLYHNHGSCDPSGGADQVGGIPGGCGAESMFDKDHNAPFCGESCTYTACGQTIPDLVQGPLNVTTGPLGCTVECSEPSGPLAWCKDFLGGSRIFPNIFMSNSMVQELLDIFLTPQLYLSLFCGLFSGVKCVPLTEDQLKECSFEYAED